MKEDTLFYNDLIKQSKSLKDLLDLETNFQTIPTSWFVVITDVEESTLAVQNGLHNEVNLAAIGSIIAVLNEIKKNYEGTKTPYFFGGDGATFIIPKNVHDAVLKVLNNHSQNIRKSLGLYLRVGSIAVNEIYENNYDIKIAKLKLNKYLTIPIILGNGLNYAEDIIKSRAIRTNDIKYPPKVNLNGMECRWDEIAPPVERQKIICLLINCSIEKEQAAIYSKIVTEIELIFGNLNTRQPITSPKLKLDTAIAKIKKEMYARIGKYNWLYLIKNWFITILGSYYFEYLKTGKEYLYKVSQLTNTLMIDGNINTVIAGNDSQIKQLQAFLDKLETKKKIVYGIHITHASVMSCYVEDRIENHIHFVDGTEGGYTAAASSLKSKMR